jgi:hypothetical protein
VAVVIEPVSHLSPRTGGGPRAGGFALLEIYRRANTSASTAVKVVRSPSGPVMKGEDPTDGHAGHTRPGWFSFRH